jgi:hypothetical protein
LPVDEATGRPVERRRGSRIHIGRRSADRRAGRPDGERSRRRAAGATIVVANHPHGDRTAIPYPRLRRRSAEPRKHRTRDALLRRRRRRPEARHRSSGTASAPRDGRCARRPAAHAHECPCGGGVRDLQRTTAASNAGEHHPAGRGKGRGAGRRWRRSPRRGEPPGCRRSGPDPESAPRGSSLDPHLGERRAGVRGSVERARCGAAS